MGIFTSQHGLTKCVD